MHLLLLKICRLIQVVIVAGFHLFPFRTEKLSPPAPMVLHTRGRVGSRRFFREPLESIPEALFVYIWLSALPRVSGRAGPQRKD